MIVLDIEPVSGFIMKQKNFTRQAIKDMPGSFVLENQVTIPAAGAFEIGKQPGIFNDIAWIYGGVRIWTRRFSGIGFCEGSQPGKAFEGRAIDPDLGNRLQCISLRIPWRRQ